MFIVLAVLLGWDHRMEHHAHFGFSTEDLYSGNQVPDAYRNNIRSKKVNLVESVVLLIVVTAAAATEITGPPYHRRGLDLNPQQAAVVFDADVVSERVSPGFEDVISVRGGGRHEKKFDPFATLFESLEMMPMIHWLPLTCPENTKGATGGPRLSENLFYISRISNWRG